ncbi:hypothetical protein C5167_005224 [Papaver somniferum]|uniref:Uncharacterized protein n=1 Tax=Papaver somniferum TaxID=3469 RepID=A0A4Y7JBN3_PAPSO|nr:hypothetical protein C5167_005224 [Papaver somniferum]
MLTRQYGMKANISHAPANPGFPDIPLAAPSVFGFGHGSSGVNQSKHRPLQLFSLQFAADLSFLHRNLRIDLITEVLLLPRSHQV